MKKSLIKNISIALVIFIILGILIFPKLNIFESDEQAAGPRSPGVIPVNAIVIKTGILEEKIVAAGNILPNEEVEISSETSGRIVAIYFREGAQVSKGQLLLKINDSDLQAQLQRLQHERKLAHDSENRQRQLLEKEAISRQEYEQSLTRVNTLDAEIQYLRAQISKTEIRAPFSGVIGLRYVSEGTFIAPNTRIARLVDLQPLKIDFSIPEKYAGIVKKGDLVNFLIENTEREHVAEVMAVETKIDADTRTLKVRAIYPNAFHEVVPGSFARVELILKTMDDALLVPTEAIIPELGGQKVYIMKDGKAQPVKIDVGIRTENNIQVLRGLNVNDTVVTTGILQVRPGANLQITKLVNE